MIKVVIEPTFAAWRLQARELLLRKIPPEVVVWQDAEQQASLFQPDDSTLPAASSSTAEIKIPKDFLPLAISVCAHRDERRWHVLYRLLYRLTLGGERHLLNMPSDVDTHQCQVWVKGIRRDIHKMHAFVRFRKIAVDETTGREGFVAWFEPTYRVVRLAAPFFEKRFAGMDWAILTPDECVYWNGEKLSFLPGVSKDHVPVVDAHDDLWRTYYRSIFNPARLKVQAMQSEMPQKYWKNLPEAQLIPELIAQSSGRVEKMMQAPERPIKPVPDNAYLRSLRQQQG